MNADGLRTQAVVRRWGSDVLHGGGGGWGVTLRWALRPATLITRACAVPRVAARDDGQGVVSVGGLTIGGAGKTPLTAACARILLADVRVAIVTRGYATRVARADVQRARCTDPAERVGDEPLALARALGDAVHVIVARDRARGVRIAQAMGAQITLLDDGFQTWRCARDVDVVALDAWRPFGTGALLPSGTLREPVEGLQRAHIVVLTRVDGAPREALDRTRAAVRRYAPSAVYAETAHRTGVLSGPRVEGQRVWLVTGVARSSSVADGVAALGARLVGRTEAPDHHMFAEHEIAFIAARVRAARADVVVLTDKDAARMDATALGRFGCPVSVVGVEIEWRAGYEDVRHLLLDTARARVPRPV